MKTGVLLSLAALFTAGAAHAADKLAISYSEKVGGELPFFMALDGGYFAKNGLDVAEKYLPAQQGIPALLAGQVQMVSLGAADGLAAEAQGVRLKYVAVLAPIYPFQMWALPQFASPAKLKGQKVAVASTTGTLYSATVLELKALGLKPSDVIITSTGSAQNNLAALLAGSVAATTEAPPLTYPFQQRGMTLMVDLAKEKIPTLTIGLAGEAAYVAAHRDIVQRAVTALTEAIARMKSDKSYSEQEFTKYFGIKDRGELDATYDFYANEVVPRVPAPTVAQLATARDTLAANNPKVKSVDLAAMVDPRFAEAAAANARNRP